MRVRGGAAWSTVDSQSLRYATVRIEDSVQIQSFRFSVSPGVDHIGPLTRADGSPNYDPDGQLKCSDLKECPAQTDFVLGEPTGEFLASMTAYDVAIADAYNDPLTNFSLDHYKFPQVVPAAM